MRHTPHALNLAGMSSIKKEAVPMTVPCDAGDQRQYKAVVRKQASPSTCKRPFCFDPSMLSSIHMLIVLSMF